MKNIKLTLLSLTVCALLASCGMNTNTAKVTTTDAPKATMQSNVSQTDNGDIDGDTNDTGNMANKASDAANDVGDTAGNIVRDAGDTVGDVAEDAGEIAGDAINGAGDAVGLNDANGNGQ